MTLATHSKIPADGDISQSGRLDAPLDPRRSWHEPRTRWADVRALLLMFLLLRILVSDAYHGATVKGMDRVDFHQYFNAAEHLRSGEPLYSQDERTVTYPYSPFIAMAIQPLVKLGYDRVIQLWTIGQLAILLLAIGLYCLAEAGKAGWLGVGLITVTAFHNWPAVIELWWGNCNMALLACLAAMYLAERRRWPWLLVLAIVIAGLVKTWAFGLVMYPVLCRRWRLAATAVACFALALLAIFAIAGFHNLPGFVRVTTRAASQPWLVALSIPGMARLYLAPNPLVRPFSVSRPVYLGVIVALYAGLVGGLVAVYRRRVGPERQHVLLGFAAVSLLLALPLCHNTYYLLALPLLWTGLLDRRASRALFVVSVLALVAMSYPSPVTVPLPAAYRAGWRSLQIGTIFACGVAAWVAALACLLKRPTPAPRPVKASWSAAPDRPDTHAEFAVR